MQIYLLSVKNNSLSGISVTLLSKHILFTSEHSKREQNVTELILSEKHWCRDGVSVRWVLTDWKRWAEIIWHAIHTE